MTTQPETLAQARRWESLKNTYLKSGLCHRCASQAAYGHQLGFTRIKAPCEDCVPLVRWFPITTASEWRVAV